MYYLPVDAKFTVVLVVGASVTEEVLLLVAGAAVEGGDVLVVGGPVVVEASVVGTIICTNTDITNSVTDNVYSCCCMPALLRLVVWVFILNYGSLVLQFD